MHITFKPYLPSSAVRYAVEITKDMTFKEIGKRTSILNPKGLRPIRFHHSVTPKVGDFIVYVTACDVYHCPRAVFLERNTLEVCPTSEPITW